MAKDPRLFIKIALDFADNEKIAPLSDAAFRALVEMTIWSRKQESDGWLASRLALAKWSPEVVHELSTNHPQFPSLVACEDGEKGWQIHDYADHQETKADIEARRERNKLNGQKGGLARGKQVAKRPASDSPSETQAEIETEIEVTTTAKAVVGQRRRGHRIPESWKPSEATKAWARENYSHLNLNDQYQAFMDHWLSATGQSSRKLDWDRAFKNWLRNARPTTRVAAVNNTHDDKVNGFLAYAHPSTQKEIS